MINVRGIALSKITLIFLIIVITSSGFPITHSIPQDDLFSHKVMKEIIQSDYIIQNPLRIGSDNDFIALGFEGSGEIYDPYIIQGFNITSTRYCVHVTNTSAFFTIKNCTFTSNTTAVYLSGVSNGRIEDCSFNRADDTCVTIADGTGCSIVNCMISGSIQGIALWNTTDTTIRNSLVYQNEYGIVAGSGNELIVRNNTIYGNERIGITLDFDVHNSQIYSNRFGWNGITIDSDGPVINAEDNGAANMWFDDIHLVGNSWNDFEPDEDYIIRGINGGIDRYPTLLLDATIPEVSALVDISIEDGEEAGTTIEWNATDEFPFQYQIYQNNDLLATERWTEEHVEIVLSNMTVGVYNYSIRFTDFSGNNVTDTIAIIIYDPIFGDMGTPIVLFASILSVVSIGVLILFLKRKP